MTYIKPDPEMQEEQEDLFMSYLNADYLSAESTPLSPPSSTSSSSETTGSPEKQIVDDFMLDMSSTDFLANENWAAHQNLFTPCLPQQQPGVDLLDAFSFLLPPTAPNFIQPITTVSPTVAPTTTTTTTAQSPSSSSSSTCSLSDSEQPKKKRGRKKREPVTHNVTPLPSLLAPKPLAPRPHLDTSPIVIKTEPSIQSEHPLLAGPTNTITSTSTTTTTNTSLSSSSTPSSAPTDNNSKQQEQLDQKQVQIQKRQERLIKNRAAALLSRKRKREHLSCLEEEKQTLLEENEKLNKKVNDLESRINSLEQENLDLKQRLQISNTSVSIGHNKRPLISTTKSSKASGVVFMIILFSFALFTLPSRTADRLTVGGSSVLENNKKQFPLIGSSNNNYDYPVEQQQQQQQPYCQTEDCDMVLNSNTNNSTDLVLIDAVRPRDLQTWINQKSNQPSTLGDKQQRHIYLFSKEFSQIAPMNQHQASFLSTSTDELPILSLISPYNQSQFIPSSSAAASTAATTEEEEEYDPTEEKYLQIDVQVLRSTVIRSQLLPLQQCDSADALLDGMRKDLIINQPSSSGIANNINNVTPPVIVKREKRAASRKFARVVS